VEDRTLAGGGGARARRRTLRRELGFGHVQAIV